MSFNARTFAPVARRSIGRLSQPSGTWPASLLDPSYAKAVLAAVVGKDYALTWTPLTVQSSDGQHTIVLRFSTDSLKIGGVRVNVSATLQQQIADALGALLPTPKIMDIAWLQRGATLPPVLLPIAATATAMIQASARIDAEIATLGAPDGVMMAEKTWAIGNSLLAHPGKAMNYGDFVIPNQVGYKFSGIGTEACVSFPLQPQLGRVIQGQGWAHDPSHLDYSQDCWLVHRSCIVDGVESDLANVLQDPTLAPLVSHEGVLKVLRQPGVPQFACPFPSTLVRAFVSPSSGLCPSPGPPENIVYGAATSIPNPSLSPGTVFLVGSLGFAAGALIALAEARARRS